MKSRPGSLGSYRVVPIAGGSLHLIGQEEFIVGPGVLTHFTGDHRIYRNDGGKMTPLNGPLTGSAAPSAPADTSGTVTSLISIRTQLDALIAKLKS